jgi:hypothetical protein
VRVVTDPILEASHRSFPDCPVVMEYRDVFETAATSKRVRTNVRGVTLRPEETLKNEIGKID